MCSSAKITGAELTDNFREKKQLDCRGKSKGCLQLKREGLGTAEELVKSCCV